MKKWLSALLAFVMVLSLLPVWAMAADDDEELPGEQPEDAAPEFVPGFIPEEFEYEYPTVEEIHAAYPEDELYAAAAKYDGRSGQTPVKNQYQNGLCWSFATYGALEANMKKLGQGTLDFSELHMGYSTSTYTYNGKTVNEEQGYKNGGQLFNTIKDGGNRTMSSAYLMRGSNMSGTVNEKDDPYVSNVTTMRNPSVTAGKTKTYTPQNILFLTGSNKATSSEVDIIKNAVVKYGSVGASMQWSDSCYNKSTASYYSNVNITNGGHMVLIVGWDDNYSKTKFLSSRQPSKNGAWLVKNSWGTNWGDKGYFWLSYEDVTFPSEAFTFDGGATAWNAKSMHIYESDYKGWGGKYYWSSGTAQFAKVFPIDSSARSITSVRVFIPFGGSVKVEADVVASFKNFNSYKFTSRASKTVAYPGWYTIDLKSPVSLGSSGKFAVVLRISGKPSVGYDEATALGNSEAYYQYGSGSFTSCTYNWQIKAISGKTSTPSVAAPTNVKATASGTKVTVTWTKVTGATKYAVYRKAKGESSWTKLSDTVTAATYADSKVTAGTTYYYCVKAYKNAWSSKSDNATVAVPASTVPAPTNLKATASGTKVALTWKKVTGATKYAVYRKAKGESEWTQLSASVTAATYTDSGVKAGTTYYYCVKAYKNAWSSKSDNVTVTVPASTVPAPTNVKATASGTKVTVTWDKVTGATKYAVYRKAKGESEWTQLSASATAVKYTDSTVKAGTTYYYCVKAYKSAWSSKSDNATVTVPAATVPAPTNVKATASGTKVTVTWTKVSGATKYAVYRKAKGESSWTMLSNTVTAATYTDSTVKAGTTYYYCVKAYKSAWSSKSDNATVTVPAATVPAPTNVKATSSGTKVTMTWAKVTGATKYAVYRKAAGESEWTKLTTTLTSAQYVDKEVTSGTTYAYRVRAYAGAWSGYSETVKITVPAASAEEPAVDE